MKLDASPWARERLGPAAVEALESAPGTEPFRLALGRSKSGWGATLIKRTRHGYDRLGAVAGCDTPAAAIEAVMEVARPKPRAVA